MPRLGWIMEREAEPVIREVEAAPPPEGEEGRLLAAALTAVLLEYRRQLAYAGEGQAGETSESGGAAVEWRVLGRWEQMAPASQVRRQGRA